MGTNTLLWRAKDPDAKNPDGGYVPVSNANPLPVHGLTLMTATAAGNYRRVPEGSSEAFGAFLDRLLVIPTRRHVGPITITDGDTAIEVFAGGELDDLRPFSIPIGASGNWSITTGGGLSVLATGSFK